MKASDANLIDIRIYSYPLSDGEVLFLYTNVAPGFEDCLSWLLSALSGDSTTGLIRFFGRYFDIDGWKGDMGEKL